MTTPDAPDTTERDLGKLEGRVEEQGTRLDQIHADMTTGFQQVNSRIDQTNSRIDQTNARMDAGFQQVNSRIDQLSARIDRFLLAMLGIGGGMLVALVGIIITLLLRGAP